MEGPQECRGVTPTWEPGWQGLRLLPEQCELMGEGWAQGLQMELTLWRHWGLGRMSCVLVSPVAHDFVSFPLLVVA